MVTADDPNPLDLMHEMLEGVDSPGNGTMPQVHLALATIAQELRTANLIAAAQLFITNQDGQRARESVRERLDLAQP